MSQWATESWARICALGHLARATTHARRGRYAQAKVSLSVAVLYLDGADECRARRKKKTK